MKKNHIFRKPTDEDLKDLRFKPDRKCSNCEYIKKNNPKPGAYRTTEMYLCAPCYKEIVTIEEWDEDED